MEACPAGLTSARWFPVKKQSPNERGEMNISPGPGFGRAAAEAYIREIHEATDHADELPAHSRYLILKLGLRVAFYLAGEEPAAEVSLRHLANGWTYKGVLAALDQVRAAGWLVRIDADQPARSDDLTIEGSRYAIRLPNMSDRATGCGGPS